MSSIPTTCTTKEVEVEEKTKKKESWRKGGGSGRGTTAAAAAAAARQGRGQRMKAALARVGGVMGAVPWAPSPLSRSTHRRGGGGPGDVDEKQQQRPQHRLQGQDRQPRGPWTAAAMLVDRHELISFLDDADADDLVPLSCSPNTVDIVPGTASSSFPCSSCSSVFLFDNESSNNTNADTNSNNHNTKDHRNIHNKATTTTTSYDSFPRFPSFYSSARSSFESATDPTTCPSTATTTTTTDDSTTTTRTRTTATMAPLFMIGGGGGARNNGKTTAPAETAAGGRTSDDGVDRHHNHNLQHLHRTSSESAGAGTTSATWTLRSGKSHEKTNSGSSKKTTATTATNMTIPTICGVREREATTGATLSPPDGLTSIFVPPPVSPSTASFGAEMTKQEFEALPEAIQRKRGPLSGSHSEKQAVRGVF
ncbi:hypothetical protein CKAH01_08002 [Colletotrichum kahawae]|uniref:Uncharacterized protein n=1 Tax=Colletotrichum kahawae TaxID=34407 RepID=A0AAD9Y3M9_COLKA|nr:hypothetical protein CKAH01_08002 [Colletotrichum kahawae]